MTGPDPAKHLADLQQWRNRKEKDLSLHFLEQTFKREVERPYKQLASLVELWKELVPDRLAGHTRLEALERGVLRVSCASSAVLYELDQQLRGGLQRELITRHSGPAVRRVQLQVGSFEEADPQR